MKLPSSQLQATMSSIKPFACFLLAVCICLHLFWLDIAAARMFPSNSASCMHNPALQTISVSKYMHNQLMQQGASNFQRRKPEPRRRGKISDHFKSQALNEAGGDSSRGSNIKDGHIQNTTPRGRAMMGKLGSTPPSCVMRCAGCVPCTPVHVPIHQGRKRIGLLEYYPEAWRCKCKNKLYMPGLSTLP